MVTQTHMIEMTKSKAQSTTLPISRLAHILINFQHQTI